MHARPGSYAGRGMMMMLFVSCVAGPQKNTRLKRIATSLFLYHFVRSPWSLGSPPTCDRVRRRAAAVAGSSAPHRVGRSAATARRRAATANAAAEAPPPFRAPARRCAAATVGSDTLQRCGRSTDTVPGAHPPQRCHLRGLRHPPSQLSPCVRRCRCRHCARHGQESRPQRPCRREQHRSAPCAPGTRGCQGAGGRSRRW